MTKRLSLLLATVIAGSCLPAFAKSSDTLVLSVPEGGAVWMYVLLAGGCCFAAMFLRSTHDR